MSRFAGKVAVVTGASSGIGLATAQQLAAEGAKVVLGARGKERLDAAVKSIKDAGGEAIGVAMDAASEEDNKRLVTVAMETYGQINVSFINAGVAGPAPGVEITDEVLDKLHAINIKGVAFALKHQLPAIERSGGNGSVVINSSVSSEYISYYEGLRHVGAYAATKAAVNMHMRYAAMEAITHGTRVNAIAPGGVQTSIIGDDVPDAVWQEFGAAVHLNGRIGRPEEISKCVCFLASDEASFVVGTVLFADGGFSIKA